MDYIFIPPVLKLDKTCKLDNSNSLNICNVAYIHCIKKLYQMSSEMQLPRGTVMYRILRQRQKVDDDTVVRMETNFPNGLLMVLLDREASKMSELVNDCFVHHQLF